MMAMQMEQTAKAEAQLVRYDAACKALAEAKATDEVKEIRDKAEALRAYGRLAKNKQMELDAIEISRPGRAAARRADQGAEGDGRAGQGHQARARIQGR